MRSSVTSIYFKTSGTWMRFSWLHIQEQQIDSGCGSDKHFTEQHYVYGKPVHGVTSNNIQPPQLGSATATLFTQYQSWELYDLICNIHHINRLALKTKGLVIV